MTDKNMKVLWICSVSNPRLRENIDLYLPWWRKIRNFIHKSNSLTVIPDYAQWNTNALLEFERIEEVELHVVFVHPFMKKKIQQFTKGGIKYYAVKEYDDSLFGAMVDRFFNKQIRNERTWNRISFIVDQISPRIIHVMGAENPNYSLSLLKLPRNIPSIVQLQTILQEPDVLQYYPSLTKQQLCERDVILRADYIGTKSNNIASIVKRYIKKDAVFINTQLLLAETAVHCIGGKNEKKYDFVYFARSINKAIDLAVDALAIAVHSHPDITLDIIGGYTDVEVNELKRKIDTLGIKSNVVIEGTLPTHEDVINQVGKSRFALLPLKIDYVSGTIREAMWNGLPVVTTVTKGTPSLNEKRESVLLSEIGDSEAMATNMLRLYEDSALAERIRENALKTVEERYGNNASRANRWIAAYRACIDNFYNGTPLPDSVVNSF